MTNFRRHLKRLADCAALALLLPTLALPLFAAAADLPRATPEQVDLSSQRLGLITEALKADVAANKIPGAVLLIARRGKVAYFESVGKLDAATS